MRWFPFFILAYVTLGLQLGLSLSISYRSAVPNLVLILVVFIASNAPRDTALLSAFLLGLFHDMISIEPLGYHAFAYGVMGLLVSGSRQVAYRDHPLTHFFLTLCVALLTAVIFWIHSIIRPPGQPLELPSGEVLPAIRPAAGVFFLSALYTALAAVPVLWLMTKTKPLLGFKVSRKRY